MKVEIEKQKELISKILLYISKADTKDEKYIAFGLINSDIIEFTKLLGESGDLDIILKDRELKRDCVNIVSNKNIKLQSIIHFNLTDVLIDGKKYCLSANLMAPIQDYCEMVLTKKVKKFLKFAGLSYIKLSCLESCVSNNYKIIYELGHKKIGKEHDVNERKKSN